LLQVTLLQLSVAQAPPFDDNQLLIAFGHEDEQLRLRLLAHLVILGGVLSFTVMLALVVAVLPQASLAVNVTDTEALHPVGRLPL